LQFIATQISDFKVKILEVATGLQLIATKIATVATGIAIAIITILYKNNNSTLYK